MTKGKKTDKSRDIILLSALAAASLMPGHAFAKTTPPCVQTAISLTVVTQPLDFATALPCTGTAGAVVINKTTGVRTTTGCITSTSGTASRAKVRIKGNNDGGRTIQVTITNASSATVAAGTKSMSVTAIQMKQGAPTYSFNGNFTKTVDIGGNVNVGAGQTDGTYTGAFTVNAVCL